MNRQGAKDAKGRQELGVLRLLAWLIGRLPFRALPLLGACLGLLAGSLLRIRRRHVEASMRAAGIEPARPLARAMYASLGTGLFELFWMIGRPREDLGSKIAFAPQALEILSQYRAMGRGVIVATAHTGNWDLVACAAAEIAPLSIVTKRLSLGSLDRFWQKARATRGVRLVFPEGAKAKVGEALRENGLVALLVDQAPSHSRGFVELPFLGRMARCDLTPALLAARYRAPLILALGRRLEDGTHLVSVPLLLEPPSQASRAWVIEATAQIQAAVEAFVREHPSQWLWLHRRWKLARGNAQPASSPSPESASASSVEPSCAPASPSSQVESAK